jgi:hypothetical protein
MSQRYLYQFTFVKIMFIFYLCIISNLFKFKLIPKTSMIYTSIYKIGQYYLEKKEDLDEDGNDIQNKQNEPSYFFQKQPVLLIAGGVIYFLLMNIEAFKIVQPFYALIIPLDLYMLNREIKQDEKKYKNWIQQEHDNTDILSTDSNDEINIFNTNDPVKINNIITSVYQYLKNKQGKSSLSTLSPQQKKLQNKNNPSTELIAKNYQPNIMKLCETMEHTLDNIMDQEDN